MGLDMFAAYNTILNTYFEHPMVMVAIQNAVYVCILVYTFTVHYVYITV